LAGERDREHGSIRFVVAWVDFLHKRIVQILQKIKIFVSFHRILFHIVEKDLKLCLETYQNSVDKVITGKATTSMNSHIGSTF